MILIDQIKQVHIEITTRCQARCPMCPRNYRGSDYNSGYPLTELTVANIAQILTPIVKQLEFVNFNGNLGDFSSAKEGQEAIHWLLENTNATISIMTNGSARSSSWWAKLADPRVIITFDLDGLDDVHSVYRIGTDWNKAFDNAIHYIRQGGRAVWQMIPFEHNKHQIEECRKLAKQSGFEDFSLIDQGRNQGPVYDNKGNFTHWLGIPENNVPPLDAMLENHKTWYNNINKSKISPKEIVCHAKRANEIYIAADGTVYPCCYLGFYPATMKQPGNEQLKELVGKNNALEYGLEDAIKWFTKVESSWKKQNVEQGLLYGCASTCGRN